MVDNMVSNTVKSAFFHASINYLTMAMASMSQTVQVPEGRES